MSEKDKLNHDLPKSDNLEKAIIREIPNLNESLRDRPVNKGEDNNSWDFQDTSSTIDRNRGGSSDSKSEE